MIKQMFLIIMVVLAPALVPNSAQAAGHVVRVHQYKEIHTLACEGAFMGYPAVVVGKREYVPHNNL